MKIFLRLVYMVSEKDIIKNVTTPVGASILIMLIMALIYLIVFEGKKIIKFMIYIFVVSYGVILVNNEYLFKTFDLEKTIPGSYPA